MYLIEISFFKKWVFLGLNIREEGYFSKLDNADMSYVLFYCTE